MSKPKYKYGDMFKAYGGEIVAMYIGPTPEKYPYANRPGVMHNPHLVILFKGGPSTWELIEDMPETWEFVRDED